MLDLFNKRKVSLLRENIEAKDDIIQELNSGNSVLRARLNALEDNNLNIPIDFNLNEPIDSEDRNIFISRIAGFYNDILKDKIKETISGVRSQLAKVDSTVDDKGNSISGYSPQEFDLLLKGTENALWLIDDWGKQSIAEHVENQRGISDEEVKGVKKIIET